VVIDGRQQFEERAPNDSRIAQSCCHGPEQSDRVTNGNVTVWYIGTGSVRFDRFRLIGAVRWRSRRRDVRRCDSLVLTRARRVAGIRVLSSELFV